MRSRAFAYFRFPFVLLLFVLLLACERLVPDDEPDVEEPSYLLAVEAMSLSSRSISLELPRSGLFGRPFFELPAAVKSPERPGGIGGREEDGIV